ncbi:hypothetical protein [Xenorhabdus miraniensis]|uniref:Uncharacterized protein n=1 Tax=Xenorhabdus miraniensis TaxID=351674 RepID=A0A2D0JL53_9GAMM|nr:hypothetical protein [Xenorhabdus miraniensis]PHM46879.1 hypothetical protein Xmir_03801 [Xenorhabdus miraniensis]
MLPLRACRVPSAHGLVIFYFHRAPQCQSKLNALPEDQSDLFRHKCAGCAYELGFQAKPARVMSERMFKYDDGEFSEDFFPHYGIATITIGNPRSGGIMQQLTNCKKEQE